MYFESIYYSSVILVVKILPNIDTYVSFSHIIEAKPVQDLMYNYKVLTILNCNIVRVGETSV